MKYPLFCVSSPLKGHLHERPVTGRSAWLVSAHPLVSKCRTEPTGCWRGVDELQDYSVQPRDGRDQLTLIGGWSVRCRFTRHINSSRLSTCPSKGHLLDRQVTGRLIVRSAPNPGSLKRKKIRNKYFFI